MDMQMASFTHSLPAEILAPCAEYQVETRRYSAQLHSSRGWASVRRSHRRAFDLAVRWIHL